MAQSLKYAHQKISKKEGGFEGKLKREHHFGMGVADIGDVNLDGVRDLAVGAMGVKREKETYGGVWILFMNRDGTVADQRLISYHTEGFDADLTPEGQFGHAIVPLGDLNGDGVPDLVVGEPGSDIGGMDCGAAWVLFLAANGSVTHYVSISQAREGWWRKWGKGFRMGTALTFLASPSPDSTCAGTLVLGTSMPVPAARGEFWLMDLRADGQPTAPRRYSAGAEAVPLRLYGGDLFGETLVALGDVNGDGFEDLAVGASGDDEGGKNTGAVYILMLGEQQEVLATQKIGPVSGNFSGILDNDDRFGCSVGALGDMNGDSIPDLVVGSRHDDDGSPNRGAIWVIYLDEAGRVLDQHKVSQTTGNFEGELDNRYQWGQAVAGVRDLTQDGFSEIAVGGPMDRDGGKETGACWLLFPRLGKLKRLASQSATSEAPAAYGSFTSAYDEAIGAGPVPDSLGEDAFDLTGVADNHLIFLLDVSASMRRAEKLPVLRKAFQRLLEYLRPHDRISVITYSGKPRLALEAVPVENNDQIERTLQNLVSKGSTKTYKALKMAYRLAEAHYIPNGNNRIILATDGGFEVSRLHRLTSRYARPDLPLSVFFFGKLPGHKIEDLMELARQGQGNCAHLQPGQADRALLREVKAVRQK